MITTTTFSITAPIPKRRNLTKRTLSPTGVGRRPSKRKRLVNIIDWGHHLGFSKRYAIQPRSLTYLSLSPRKIWRHHHNVRQPPMRLKPRRWSRWSHRHLKRTSLRSRRTRACKIRSKRRKKTSISYFWTIKMRKRRPLQNLKNCSKISKRNPNLPIMLNHFSKSFKLTGRSSRPRHRTSH